MFVHVDDCATDARLASRVIGFAMNRRSEAIDDVALLHANDAAVTSSHTQVREIGRALVQDSFVGGLHVRVRAQHGRDAAIEKPTHGDFFRSCFGVHIDEANLDFV